MPRRSDGRHVESAPHFDGSMNRIINDAVSSKTANIGVHFNEKIISGKSPLDITPKKDFALEQISEIDKRKPKK